MKCQMTILKNIVTDRLHLQAFLLERLFFSLSLKLMKAFSVFFSFIHKPGKKLQSHRCTRKSVEVIQLITVQSASHVSYVRFWNTSSIGTFWTILMNIGYRQMHSMAFANDVPARLNSY